MGIAKVVRTKRAGQAGSDPVNFVHSCLFHGGRNRVCRQEMAFEMLEPYASKGTRTVLRELGDGNIPRLPDL
jgi:hypothetical protein